MAVGVLAAAAVAAAADKSVHFVTMVQETEVLVVVEVAKAAKAEAADMAVADLLPFTLITMVQTDNWLIVIFSPGLVVKEGRAAKEEQAALGVLEAEYKLRVRMRLEMAEQEAQAVMVEQAVLGDPVPMELANPYELFLETPC